MLQIHPQNQEKVVQPVQGPFRWWQLGLCYATQDLTAHDKVEQPMSGGAKCLADAKAQCLADLKEGDLLDERCLRFRCFLELRFFPR